MREIQLTRSKVALVDDADFDWLSQWKWCALKTRKHWYAVRTVNKRTIYMHRLILDAPEGSEVDHEDLNGLNNQRSNIRLPTKAQNSFNNGAFEGSTSRFVGVSWDKTNQRWTVHCTDRTGKDRNLGNFAMQEHGEFAKTNKMLGLL